MVRDLGARPARAIASGVVSTRDAGGRSGSGSAGSVGVCVSATLAISVSELTIRAAAIAGLAIVALLLTGWRKPARAEPGSPRGGPIAVIRTRRTDPYATGVAVDHFDTPTERKVGVVRRLLALAASGGIGVGMGVLAAIVIAFASAWAVIWLTALLRG
jgi:hypothetical protein